MAKVFSVTDFKEGWDVRKTPLTAPGGSLRILENAVINQGGEIAKRYAFVPMTNLPSDTMYMFGQGNQLHIFGVGHLGTINPGTCPVPITGHILATAPVTITKLIDCEAYNDKFYVTGLGTDGLTYIWYNNVLVKEVDGSQSRGGYSRTYKTKMYRADGAYLRFAGVNDPAVNDPASSTNPGAGFINLAINDPDGETLEGMEVYYNQMAVFSRLTTQLWTLDPDPSLDKLDQVLRIGTLAPHSILQFGTGDVLFLSDSGVRSLKTLYVNIAASVSDVGSPIDLALIPVLRNNPAAAGDAVATIQPIQGRYWLHIAGTIYILSYFPAGKITAWSTYVPGFTVANFSIVTNEVYVRDTNNVLYLYGGLSGTDWDSTTKVTVRTPHMSVDTPTRRKLIQSVDVMCTGAWSVSIGMLPNNTDAFELAANVVNNTYGNGSIPFAGYGTHIGLELVHQAPGDASLAAIHLNVDEASLK